MGIDKLNGLYGLIAVVAIGLYDPGGSFQLGAARISRQRNYIDLHPEYTLSARVSLTIVEVQWYVSALLN